MSVIICILVGLVLVVALGGPSRARGYQGRGDGSKTPPVGGSAVRPRHRPF